MDTYMTTSWTYSWQHDRHIHDNITDRYIGAMPLSIAMEYILHTQAHRVVMNMCPPGWHTCDSHVDMHVSFMLTYMCPSCCHSMCSPCCHTRVRYVDIHVSAMLSCMCPSCCHICEHIEWQHDRHMYVTTWQTHCMTAWETLACQHGCHMYVNLADTYVWQHGRLVYVIYILHC